MSWGKGTGCGRSQARNVLAQVLGRYLAQMSPKHSRSCLVVSEVGTEPKGEREGISSAHVSPEWRGTDGGRERRHRALPLALVAAKHTALARSRPSGRPTRKLGREAAQELGGGVFLAARQEKAACQVLQSRLANSAGAARPAAQAHAASLRPSAEEAQGRTGVS